MTGSLQERFNHYTLKALGCWEWQGYGDRYGVLNVKGRATKAHRLSWELHYGPIPSKLCVLHSYDNGKCVNPEHLFLGTQKDNIHDAIRKGRAVFPKVLRGEEKSNSKLTEMDILVIRLAMPMMSYWRLSRLTWR